jgi:hypothetical protein
MAAGILQKAEGARGCYAYDTLVVGVADTVAKVEGRVDWALDDQV